MKLILNEVICFSPVNLVFVSLIYRASGREPRRVNGKRFFFSSSTRTSATHIHQNILAR